MDTIGGSPFLPLRLTQECPCVLTEDTLKMLRNYSSGTDGTAQGQLLFPGEEVPANSTLHSACSNW